MNNAIHIFTNEYCSQCLIIIICINTTNIGDSHTSYTGKDHNYIFFPVWVIFIFTIFNNSVNYTILQLPRLKALRLKLNCYKKFEIEIKSIKNDFKNCHLFLFILI